MGGSKGKGKATDAMDVDVPEDDEDRVAKAHARIGRRERVLGEQRGVATQPPPGTHGFVVAAHLTDTRGEESGE